MQLKASQYTLDTTRPELQADIENETNDCFAVSTGNKKPEFYAQWVEFFPTKTQQLRDFFFQTYRPYSDAAAHRYISHCMPYRSLLDPEDIHQQADFGLLEAINSFNPYRGVSFKTHSFPRIRGSIIDGIRALQDFPRFINKVRRRLKPLIDKLQQELQRTPLIEDLVDRYPYFKVDGISITTLIHDRLITVSVFNQTQKEERLDINEETFEVENFNPIDMCLLKHHPIDTEDKTLKRIDLINYILQSLSDPCEQKVVMMYYFGGKTTNQIAKILRLSVACVSAKKISAIENLRVAARSSSKLRSLIYE